MNAVQSIAPHCGLNHADLVKAVNTVLPVIEHKSTIPILTCLNINATDDGVVVSGTDLDVNIRYRIPCKADTRFETYVRAKNLADILKKAPAADDAVLYLLPKKDEVDTRLVLGKYSYTLSGNPTPENGWRTDTPVDMDGGMQFVLDSESLWDVLDSVKGAMPTEETRYYLNGIFVHYNEDAGGLRFVATDGHRMYYQTVVAGSALSEMPGVIIPSKTVNILHKLLRQSACTVTIAVTQTHVRFTFDDVVIETKVVDGAYPHYQRVMPSNTDCEVAFDPEPMLEAIKAVTVVLDGNGRALRMDVKDDECRLSCTNPEKGSANTEIMCKLHGEPLTIGFNYRYLTEILKLASPDGETVTMRAKNEKDQGPALIEGSVKGWGAVLMPLRV